MVEEKILKLSASKVKTFKQCPRKYYYNYIEKLPRKNWPHFDLGHLVHGALEMFHDKFRKDGENLNLKRIMKVSFKETRKEMENSNKTLSGEILLEARDLLTEYLHKIEKNGLGSNVISVEEDFDIKLNDYCSVNGFVDRLDLEEDGYYRILDYKTTKSIEYMEPFQLNVYGIFLLNKYPDVDFFRASYVMMRHGGKYVSYEFNREDVEKCKKGLIKSADIINSEERWMPKQSKLCNWCDFKNTCFATW